MKAEQTPPRLPMPMTIARATPRRMSPPEDDPTQANVTGTHGYMPVAARIAPIYDAAKDFCVKSITYPTNEMKHPRMMKGPRQLYLSER